MAWARMTPPIRAVSQVTADARRPAAQQYSMSEPTVPVETGNAPGPVVAPLDRLTAAAEVFVCSGVPTQLAIQGVLAGAGWALNPGQPELSVFLTLIVADTVLVI